MFDRRGADRQRIAAEPDQRRDVVAGDDVAASAGGIRRPAWCDTVGNAQRGREERFNWSQPQTAGASSTVASALFARRGRPAPRRRRRPCSRRSQSIAGRDSEPAAASASAASSFTSRATPGQTPRSRCRRNRADRARKPHSRPRQIPAPTVPRRRGCRCSRAAPGSPHCQRHARRRQPDPRRQARAVIHREPQCPAGSAHLSDLGRQRAQQRGKGARAR